MNKNLEELLEAALIPDVQPEEALNEKILQRAREKTQMKETVTTWSKRKIAAAAAIAVAILAAGSGTAYAMWRYLTPQEAAGVLEDERLADAFSSEDAVLVNETQTCGNYRATLVGIVSGRELTDYATMSGGEVRADRSYWLMAIEHADGTPMPEGSSPEYAEESFLTSPFIQGLNPGKYNIWTLGGGYSEFVQDGILYRMAECDNLELFADREVYLCLADENSVGVIQKAYHYDEATGKITRNEDYDGCNALFVLPLDTEKADAEKAEAYLESLDKASEEETEQEVQSLPESEQQELAEWEAQVEKFVDALTADNIDELCEKKEGSEAVVAVDWDSDWVEYSTAGDPADSGGMAMSEFKRTFPDQTPRICVLGYGIGNGNGEVDAEITVLRMNEDGTITCALYMPRDLSYSER